MNERIRELAEQAGISYLSSVHPDMWGKFAELIVLECADVAYKYNRCDWADVSKSIKEHFGVEE